MTRKRTHSTKRIAAVLLASAMTLLTYTGCSEDGGGYPYGNSKRNEISYQDAESRTDQKEDAAAESNWEQQFLAEAPPVFEAEKPINGEEYNTVTERGFQSPLTAPLSTFSVDVDTACYSNLRRMLQESYDIPADAVRIEELLNYFNYEYTMPDRGEGVAPTLEFSDCPWNPKTKLMLVGLQAEAPAERPESNLVFLIDVSGSMNSPDKLALVKQCFTLLCAQLSKNDTVSIVTYSGREQVVLRGARGSDTETILNAVNGLVAEGATAGAAGIQTAYDIAQECFIQGGNNRIILATDGDLNVGISSEEALTNLIEEKRETGVYLSVLGFGTGNYSDARLEAIADHGNGNYCYIDSINEGKRVLGDELLSTLFTAAKDVKLQVEFNPVTVKGYRLIGYENRALAAEDYANDNKDAGEMGAGSQVTALYEVALSDSDQPVALSTGLEYQSTTASNSENIATLHLRYKLPDADESTAHAYPLKRTELRREASNSLRLAAAVAEFGMLLRQSEYTGLASYAAAWELLCSVSADRPEDAALLELAELMQLAAKRTLS